jgi:hypothetical protein
MLFNCKVKIAQKPEHAQKGNSQPPRNNKLNNVDISRILPYSPKKKNAKIIEEYSIL